MYIKGLVQHGFNSATTDPDTIRKIWRKRPNAGVGIKGALFLDIDPRHGGDETIKRLQREYGKLPQTFTTKSGGGGWHKAYVLPDGLAIPNELGPGIEVKTGKPGVIAAPTIHPSGQPYLLIDDPEIIELTEAWLNLMQEKAQEENETKTVEIPERGTDGAVDPDQIGTITKGERKVRMFRIARAVRDETEMQEINRRCCIPELPQKTVRTLTRRALKYPAPAKPKDPEKERALEARDRQHRETVWRYRDDHYTYTVRDVDRTLWEVANKHGWVEDGYLCVTAAFSQIEARSGVAVSSISARVLPKMEAAGLAFYAAATNRKDGGLWRLPIPTDESVNTYAESDSVGVQPTPSKVFTDCALPIPKPIRELQTPMFRGSGLVGRARPRVLLGLEGAGWTCEEELAERIGMDVRGLRRHLEDRRAPRRKPSKKQAEAFGENAQGRQPDTHPGLVSLGLVERDDGRVRLPRDYRARVRLIQNTQYDNEYLYRVPDPVSGRTVTQARGGYASENERHEMDEAAAELRTKTWRRKLKQDAEVESVAFEDLPESPDPRSEQDDGLMTPRRALLMERGWECAGCSFGIVSWIQPVTGEEVREDIAAEIEARRDERSAA